MLQDISPISGPRYILVEQASVDKCRAYIFIIEQSKFDTLSKNAWAVLPEGVLVKAWLDKHYAGKSVYLSAEQDSRIFSSLYHSADFKSWIQLQSDSLVVSGHADMSTSTDEKLSLSERQYQALLTDALTCLPASIYKQAFHSQRIDKMIKRIPWGFVAMVLGGILMAYMLATSAYLYAKSAMIESELDSQREKLAEVFSLQSRLDRETERLRTLTSKVDEMTLVTPVWYVIHQLIQPEDIEIMSLRYEDNVYFLRAKADKATTVIERLSNVNGVRSPQITSPVVKSRGDEIVTLSFAITSAKDMLSGVEDAE